MANVFWVGGTGTWDSSSTTHWSATSGGAGGAAVPTSADSVTFDGNSGGGTVTLNFGGTITIQSLTMGTFTGTFDNSVNNNNITVSGSSGFGLSGSAVRTYKLGTATYTLTSGSASWSFGTSSNATFTAGSSTITFSGGSSTKSFAGGDKTYGTVNFGAVSGNGMYSVNGSNTFAHLNITAPNLFEFQISQTQTISNSVAWAGSSGSEIALLTNSNNSATTMAFAAGSTMQWCAFRGQTCSGSPVATNSFDLGNNSGISITAPSAGGGGFVGVIGS